MTKLIHNIASWYVAPVNALVLPAVEFAIEIFVFFQIKEEGREEERQAQEVELNNLESFIYKYRREDVVKQNRPLLDKLTSLLNWVEGDGQFASLDQTKSIIGELHDDVSYFKPFFLRFELENEGFVA